MKEFIKRNLAGLRVTALTAALSLSGVLEAVAQNKSAKNVLEDGVKAVTDTAGIVVRIMMILCGISGAISIAWALIDRKNAQEGANQRLMNVGIGLLVAFVALFVIQMVLNSLGVTTGA